MIKKMIIFLVGSLLFLSLSNLVNAEEPVSAKEKPLTTELPIVVIKGTDRSYLEVMRAKTPSFMPSRGEKILIRPFFEATLGKKTYSHLLTFPGLEKKRVEEELPSPKEISLKEISPIALLEPRLSRLFISYVPTKYTRAKEISFMPGRGEKTLTKTFIQLPFNEKTYYPPIKEESLLPYLYISTSLAAYNNFDYFLNYGRKRDKMTHLLTLGRYSAPQWTTYRKNGSSSPLAKEKDWLNTELIWNSSEKRNALFNLQGYQEKINLPNEKERNKNRISLGGKLNFRFQEDNIFKISAWVERAEMGNYNVNYQDVTPGIQIELETPQIPLSTGIKAENSSYADKSQFHLWIKDEAIVFKSLKGLSVGLEVGIKKIEGATSEILPHLKLVQQFTPEIQLQIAAQKRFYLPQFADLYLSRDYVEINKELDEMVKFWNYETQLKYELSPLADLRLRGFFNKGEDIIWNWDSMNSLIKPEIRYMHSWGGQFNLRLHFGETFEQGVSYTYQKAENLQDSSKVIPHYPQNMADIWLRWTGGGWEIEVGGELIEERYYNENIKDKLPRGWKERFKISRTIGKDIEFFVQLALNDYYLWKDYTPPREKLSFGLKVKLY